MQIGQSAGVTVLLDCGGAEADISPELLQHLTIISPNESELANLTGKHAVPIGTGNLWNPIHVIGFGTPHLGACNVFLWHASVVT